MVSFNYGDDDASLVQNLNFSNGAKVSEKFRVLFCLIVYLDHKLGVAGFLISRP